MQQAHIIYYQLSIANSRDLAGVGEEDLNGVVKKWNCKQLLISTTHTWTYRTPHVYRQRCWLLPYDYIIVIISGFGIYGAAVVPDSGLGYKCLHAAAPPYLSELCIPVSTSAGRHFLRSATYGDLLVPRTSTSTYGPRSFAVSGPSVWNKLPATLRVSPTLGQFQSKLKAVLFHSAYETWLGAFVTA